MLVLGLLLEVIPKGIPAFFRQRLFPWLMSVRFPLYSAMAWGAPGLRPPGPRSRGCRLAC